MEIWKIRKLKWRKYLFNWLRSSYEAFFEILKPLGEAGIKPSIYSSHTLKPFDYDGLKKFLESINTLSV